MLNKGKNMEKHQSFTYAALLMKFLQRKQISNLYRTQYFVLHPSQHVLPL